MAPPLPAFCSPPAPFADAAGAQPLARGICVRSSRTSLFTPCVPRRTPRFAPPAPLVTTTRSLFSGNVEDLPLERIPSDASELPAYWARPGVYGVYDASGALQYVAAVRDVAAAIAVHVQLIADPDRVHAVRMITVDDIEQAPLGTLAHNWVMAHFRHGPGIPPGNSDEEPIWREEDAGFKPDVYLDPRTDPDFIDSQIRRVLRENKVVLFMKGTRAAPRCGFSQAVVEILAGMDADGFVCVDCLDEYRNRGLREAIKKYSEWPTIPQLYVDGDFVGGADIVREMHDNGELEKLLKPLAATS